MNTLLPVSDVLDFHAQRNAEAGWTRQTHARFNEGIWQYIELNHRFNTSLWDEEDLARRRDVPDSAIAANKRAIDRFNQQRNDAIEKMDELILSALASVAVETAARLNCETAGSMIDRLSIVSLKIHHMSLQTQRRDASQEHIDACAAKVARLSEQRTDLAGCLDEVLAGCQAGQVFYKVYRQFKMYNDPKLNPWLYGGKGAEGVATA